MKPFASPILVSLLAALPLAVSAEKPHVHGNAILSIAIQGQDVVIELDSPSDNILGFEHEPSTKAQKQTLESSLALLNNYQNLLTFNAGSCQQVEAKIDSPFELDEHHGEHDHHGHEEHAGHDDHHQHEEHGHDHHEEHAKHDDHHDHEEHDKHAGHDDHDHHSEHGEHKETHSDFHAQYTLKCENTTAMSSADITAFKTFKRLENVQVNWLTADKQGAQKTTGSQTKVVFK